MATAGFIAFAPDLYHGSTAASTIDQAKKLMSTLKQETVREDVVKSVSGLHVHPKVRGRGLGAIGFSMGAYWAVWLAERFPADMSAIVVFYGMGEGNFANSKAAFLGHFAEKDDYEDAASVREFERLVRAAGKDVAIHTYPGTKHWFFEKDRPDAYDAPAAKLAWDRTIRFLTTQMAGKSVGD